MKSYDELLKQISDPDERPAIFDPATLFGKDPPDPLASDEEQKEYAKNAKRVLGILLGNDDIANSTTIHAYKLASVFGQDMPEFDGVYTIKQAEEKIKALTATNPASEDRDPKGV